MSLMLHLLSAKKTHGLQLIVPCVFTLFYGYNAFIDYANCITLASSSFNSSRDNDGTQSAISSSDILHVEHCVRSVYNGEKEHE